MLHTKNITITESSQDPLLRTIDADTAITIHAAKNVEATVSLFIDPSTDALKADIRITLQPYAKLTVLCLQTMSDASVSITQKSSIEGGAHLSLHTVTLGTGQTVHDTVAHLIGEHATSDINWVFYASGNDRQTLTARNVFEAGNGGGEMALKGVAQYKAHVRCDGMIDIGLDGGGTDTYLTEDVLMLDPSAKVDAVPGLEIKTNDVKASHSATVSKVTLEDLFYFAARGIDQKQARQMYVQGFLGDLVRKIGDAMLREKVIGAIEQKYGVRSMK